MPLSEQETQHAESGCPASDLSWIVDLVEPRTQVLDLGCGTGELLHELQVKKKVFPQGIEISEDAIQACVSKGLPVYHGNIDEGLADYTDQALDYVILTNVIQVLQRPDQLLREAARVGKKVIVSFPNFAHIGSRFQLGVMGQMPRTSRLPYEWYNSPNIHLTTIRDFDRLCQEEGLRVLRKMFLRTNASGVARQIKVWPTLFADQAIYVVSRN